MKPVWKLGYLATTMDPFAVIFLPILHHEEGTGTVVALGSVAAIVVGGGYSGGSQNYNGGGGYCPETTMVVEEDTVIKVGNINNIK
jgi:hypothetical protein